jgi:flagellar secretion chaperone FliS
MTNARLASQAYRDYIETKVLSAHPVEIVQMLYQVAIDNLNAGLDCLKTGDIFGRSRAVSKAQSAVHELMFALDPKVSVPITRNLAELYDYVQRQIIAGHTRCSEQALKNALAVLTTLSEGWSGVRTTVMPGAQSQTATEQQTAAAPKTGISPLYAEPPLAPAAARDWSC